MRHNRYNVPVRRPLLRSLLVLAAVVAGLTTLTSAQGGVFSGANGRIAYTCGVTICTVDPANPPRVTLNAGLTTPVSDPSWSSDGSQIAYVDAAGGITVADADGTGGVEITPGGSQPSFSEDGLRVAYVRSGDIWSSFSNTGGGESHLTTSAAVDADPAYSPDGSEIAFASDAGGGVFHIWTMNADGSGTPQQLTTGAGGDRSPTWSPTGATIVYSHGGELFAVNTFSLVAADLGVAGTDPAFSPDGSKIAFSTPVTHGLSYMVATAGGAVTPVDTSAGNSQPDWQSVTLSGPPSNFTGPPVNVAYPTVNLSFGDTAPTLGDFLTASVGTWNGAFPITYTYQWRRCEPEDVLNGSCFDIAGARSSFYTPVAADYGKRLRVLVTATNSQGNARQLSQVTEPVTADAPHLHATPQITGGNTVDTPLGLTPGTWDGSTPLTFTYSWRRCNPIGDFASCVAIPGETDSSYTPTVADIGFSIRVWITGTNLAGSDSGITNHTFPIVDKPHFAPSTVSAPAIAGTFVVGRQLTGFAGSFSGDVPIATKRTWQRCDATGAACHAIPGATKLIYHPTAKDLGSTLRFVVLATNTYGSFVARSDPSDPVVATPPNRRGRHIVGTARGEYIAGGGFDDDILGMGGSDTILGGAGDDMLDGGLGNDVLTGGAGADRILGGAGSDTIYAADGERDVIDCGDGADRAIVDAVDVVKNCEVVETPPVATDNPPSGGSPGSGSPGSGSGSGSSGSGSPGSGSGSP
jgi:hypothetical protein